MTTLLVINRTLPQPAMNRLDGRAMAAEREMLVRSLGLPVWIVYRPMEETR